MEEFRRISGAVNKCNKMLRTNLAGKDDVEFLDDCRDKETQTKFLIKKTLLAVGPRGFSREKKSAHLYAA